MTRNAENIGVLLFAANFLTSCVLCQVATICRPNERFLTCGGCQKTCMDPAPACAAVCFEGCYCPEDMVRNNTGHCVPLSECPKSAHADYKAESTEPRPIEHKCPADEEYRLCEPCNKTCNNPNPICPAQCSKGCFCKDDLVRNNNGKCVKVDQCTKQEIISNYVVSQDETRVLCGLNQEYKNCGSCDGTCSNPNPFCVAQCFEGCFCKDGYVRSFAGECVNLDQCPKALKPDLSPSTFSQFHHLSAEMTRSGAHELTVEDCTSDEEYLSCGWCEPTCSEPHPHCPIGVCTRGCLCRPPLLRHYSGQCVEPKNCLPQKCPHSDEEYVCRYGCEARCDRSGCGYRSRGCTLGCYCKLGFLRDIKTGLCVRSEQCSK